MAKYFLFFFTVLLSLSLGLFVGQNYFLPAGSNSEIASQTRSSGYDSQIDLNSGLKKKFMLLLDKIFAKNKIQSVEIQNTEIQSDGYDIEKDESQLEYSKSDQIQKEKPIEAKDFEQDVSADLKEYKKEIVEELPRKNPQSKAQETVLTTKTNKLKIKTDPNTSSLGWAIQVGAFQLESDAQKVETLIKNFNFPSYIYIADIKGQSWFRVNVGPFSTLTEATNFKQSQKVHEKFKGAFVRQL